MAGVVPKLARTFGSIRHVGPSLGAHTGAVLRELAGCSAPELAVLRGAGVIGDA